MAKRYCDIEGCGREIGEGTGSHGGLPICTACRGSQYYWKGKGLRAIEERRERLGFWEKRIVYLNPRIEEMLAAASKKVAKVKKSAAREHRASS
jgi:hypothetical protein